MRLERVITTVLGAAAFAAAAAVPAWAAPASGRARPGGTSGSAFAPGTGQTVVDWNKTLITLLGMPAAQPATCWPPSTRRPPSGP
ncbi:MAG: hypothetical protein JO242_16445 [Streptosporangiaceae bacterium]|nr:hypothetical protein [Streptosporangiaceae bacterium]